MLKVSSIVNYLEEKYPSKFSFEWDNCGLQIGTRDREVSKALLCLTLTSAIIEKAISEKVDLIVTHHPLIFKPLTMIDTSKYWGKNIELLLKNEICVYSLHTNFDVNVNGVSDVLAEKYGFTKTKVLSPMFTDLYKIVTYIPKDKFEEFKGKFLELNVGNLGNYSHCSFSTSGEGTFLPNSEASPFIGQNGVLEKVDEIKIETIVKDTDLDKVVSTMKSFHPYEEPAYDVFSIKNKDKSIGLGRYVVLDEEKRVEDFLSVFNGHLYGNVSLDRKVKRIAFSGGSGASLVAKVAAMDIDLFITGDIDYHTAVDAEELGLSILDIGHYESEMPAMYYLKSILTDKFSEIEFVI
ncbi:MAG: Nif3-like dinuclear metal center hexameric protein [Candidatus Margulisbacteria bacterium]|nr:Nif3-like dinuclear metal center hexameric protein [Candidatus Margulisiibacteriota bacterium]